jgi:hypothetical protein
MVRGIHRRIGSNGQPSTAWVSDGDRGATVTEEEYRARGYEPSFDSLPILIVQRIPVTNLDDLCDDDKQFIDQQTSKNTH